MSEEDRELEKLKEKRLAEMQKNILYKQKQDEFLASQKKKQENMPKPYDILVNQLGYRGLEVLENAERQFPNETKIVVEKLAKLISLGEINEEIDGGKLLLLFRTVGLNIHLETKINVEQDGKFVSLSDKLSSTFSSSGESTNQE
ncbi:MAG: double-stranded DNA-binding protein [Thaumarchaeota archaeon]|nr:double-stranded DNA-binding protein [Nitrososphaerota archaeon]